MVDTVASPTGAMGAGAGFGLLTVTQSDTVTPSSSTVNGLSSIKLGAYQYTLWLSNNGNWNALLGLPQPATQTGTTYLRDDMTWQSISGSGTVTTTGSPASGNLAKFSGSTSITNGDLSGDCTTSGTLVITCLKTNGTAFGALATVTPGTNVATILAQPANTAAGVLAGALSNGHIFVGNSSNVATAVALSGDCSITNTGVITCLEANGVAFTALATTAPGTGVATAASNAVNTSGGLVTSAQTYTDAVPVVWDSNTTVANAVIPLINPQWAGGGTITSVTYYTNGSGTPSFTADVKIGSTGVTSCSALSVSSATPTTTTCTAANTFTSSSQLSLTITSASGTPNQALVQVNMTHTAN